jgi:hypothetical protein
MADLQFARLLHYSSSDSHTIQKYSCVVVRSVYQHMYKDPAVGDSLPILVSPEVNEVALDREPGWSANNGAGLITQESIDGQHHKEPRLLSPKKAVQTLPESAGPAKEPHASKEIVVEQSTKNKQP